MQHWEKSQRKSWITSIYENIGKTIAKHYPWTMDKTKKIHNKQIWATGEHAKARELACILSSNAIIVIRRIIKFEQTQLKPARCGAEEEWAGHRRPLNPRPPAAPCWFAPRRDRNFLALKAVSTCPPSSPAVHHLHSVSLDVSGCVHAQADILVESRYIPNAISPFWCGNHLWKLTFFYHCMTLAQLWPVGEERGGGCWTGQVARWPSHRRSAFPIALLHNFSPNRLSHGLQEIEQKHFISKNAGSSTASKRGWDSRAVNWLDRKFLIFNN